MKTNVIIGVGNPDEWCTQNCPPQDCPPGGNPEVGNPDIHRFLFLVSIFFWNIAGLVHSISCICGTHKTLHISSSHKTLQNLLHSDKEEETDSHFLHRKTPEKPLCRPYTGHTTDQMTKYLLCLDGALFDINRTTNLLNKNQQAKSFYCRNIEM